MIDKMFEACPVPPDTLFFMTKHVVGNHQGKIEFIGFTVDHKPLYAETPIFDTHVYFVNMLPEKNYDQWEISTKEDLGLT